MTLDTLDRLLLALLRSPRDADLIAVIADCLDETGHPAAAWWRQHATGVRRVWRHQNTSLHSGYVVLTKNLILASQCRGGRNLYLTGQWCEKNPRWPGIADLCRRLDALAALRRIASANVGH